jgi:phage shock protein PspC (stress-responsive transcriptional regulator)
MKRRMAALPTEFDDMQTAQLNLLARDDTMLGVCEALGEDFGFNANILRIVLAASLLWNAPVVVGLYLGAGLLVAVSRFAAPNPKRTASATMVAADGSAAEAEAAAEPEFAVAA